MVKSVMSRTDRSMYILKDCMMHMVGVSKQTQMDAIYHRMKVLWANNNTNKDAY